MKHIAGFTRWPASRTIRADHLLLRLPGQTYAPHETLHHGDNGCINQDETHNEKQPFSLPADHGTNFHGCGVPGRSSADLLSHGVAKVENLLQHRNNEIKTTKMLPTHTKTVTNQGGVGCEV